MPNQFGFALFGSCVRSLHLYIYFEAANPNDTSTMSSGVLDMPPQGAGGSSQETHAANPKDISTVSSSVLDMPLQGAGGSSQETHAANPNNISTMSSGVLDMHLQGAGGSSQETHAANPKDISTVSSGVLDMPLQGAGGSSQETHAARQNLDNIVHLCWFKIVQCYNTCNYSLNSGTNYNLDLHNVQRSTTMRWLGVKSRSFPVEYI